MKHLIEGDVKEFDVNEGVRVFNDMDDETGNARNDYQLDEGDKKDNENERKGFKFGNRENKIWFLLIPFLCINAVTNNIALKNYDYSMQLFYDQFELS